MQRKEFDHTNNEVSAIGVGTWKLGKNPKEEIEALRYAISNGINFIDTAEMYGTEGLVRSAIGGVDRKSLFIATKVSPHNFHYSDVIRSCEASLSRLGTDYIDLYQLHWPNHSIPISETMSAMEKLADDGKIKHIGVSNFSVKELQEAQAVMKGHRIVSDQVEYSVFVRTIEEEGLPEYCRKKGIAIIAYSPLARGLISRSGDSKIGKVLELIAKKHNVSTAQVALNWLVSKGNVVPIPKASNAEHMKENIASTDFTLDTSDIAEIDCTANRKRPIGSVFRPLLKKNAAWSRVMTMMGSKNAKIDGANIEKE
ncbi:MAG: aldo/keto reductase [Candidatus Micrarchaeia archaeon]